MKEKKNKDIDKIEDFLVKNKDKINKAKDKKEVVGVIGKIKVINEYKNEIKKQKQALSSHDQEIIRDIFNEDSNNGINQNYNLNYNKEECDKNKLNKKQNNKENYCYKNNLQINVRYYIEKPSFQKQIQFDNLIYQNKENINININYMIEEIIEELKILLNNYKIKNTIYYKNNNEKEIIINKLHQFSKLSLLYYCENKNIKQISKYTDYLCYNHKYINEKKFYYYINEICNQLNAFLITNNLGNYRCFNKNLLPSFW